MPDGSGLISEQWGQVRQSVAQAHGDSKRRQERARLIVTAVNHHAPLVAALEALVAADNCNYDRDAMRAEGYFDRAREVLASVRQAS